MGCTNSSLLRHNSTALKVKTDFDAVAIPDSPAEDTVDGNCITHEPNIRSVMKSWETGIIIVNDQVNHAAGGGGGSPSARQSRANKNQCLVLGQALSIENVPIMLVQSLPDSEFPNLTAEIPVDTKVLQSYNPALADRLEQCIDKGLPVSMYQIRQSQSTGDFGPFSREHGNVALGAYLNDLKLAGYSRVIVMGEGVNTYVCQTAWGLTERVDEYQHGLFQRYFNPGEMEVHTNLDLLWDAAPAGKGKDSAAVIDVAKWAPRRGKGPREYHVWKKV